MSAWMVVLLVVPAVRAQDQSVRFFEEKVRPILATRCQACHNDELETSDLSLASREAALEGGTRGVAVVPGYPEDSLLIVAVEGSGVLQMPPTGPLSDEEVDALRTWIRGGAAWGQAAEEPAAAASLWSLQPVRRVEPPTVADPERVRNQIDNFVLAKLDEAGLEPSPEADRRTLIRRASLDLKGLLPSPADVRRFLDDQAPNAFGRMVERLLESPHYGERWGRHWLDIARYADTNGYSIDGPRSIWQYRDWVIGALNDNMPFDQFVIEQVAGDLLPDATQAQLIATGFHRNTMVNQEGGIDFEQYRVEAVVDRVRTTGAAFLGLTLACARCHDHKFDPISQREFFQVFSYFNNVDELGGNLEETVGRSRMMEPILEFGDPELLAKRDALKKEIDDLETEVDTLQLALEPDWNTRFPPGDIPAIERAREIIGIPPEERSSVQDAVLRRVLYEHVEEFKAKKDEIEELRKGLPEVQWTMVMRDLPKPRDSYIHVQGDFTRRGEPVEPGTLSVLPPLPQDAPPNRLGLARWLVSDGNPLTPRVTMNRVWQRYFGLGIVETENDFGSQGTSPSHPGLLDWLASEFVRRDWNLKDMHRLIVNSATYRQASDYRTDAARGRSEQPVASTAEPHPPRSGSNPRRGSVRVRFAVAPSRRTKRVPATARGCGPVHAGRPQVEGGRGTESLPPGHVYLFHPLRGTSRTRAFRRTNRARERHPPQPLEHPAAGTHAPQRRVPDRIRPGSRKARSGPQRRPGGTNSVRVRTLPGAAAPATGAGKASGFSCGDDRCVRDRAGSPRANRRGFRGIRRLGRRGAGDDQLGRIRDTTVGRMEERP